MERINDYTVLKTVRQDEQGKLLLVRHPDLEQLLEATIVPIGQETKSDAITLSKLLGSLNHKNIQPVRESFLWDNQQYFVIVSEQISQGLNDINECHRDKIQSTMVDIALGLQYLHNVKRTTHGSLMLKNIRLKEDNVQMIYVGLSRLTSALPSLTWYLAPELLELGNHGYSTDIWALGVIFLELILGKKFQSRPVTMPDREDSSSELEQMVVQVMEPDIRQLIHTMLKRDPQQRPTIDQVVKSLAPQKYCSTLDTILTTNNLYKMTKDYWLMRCSMGSVKREYIKHSSAIIEEARKENPRAMFLLGRMCGFGFGVPMDVEESRQWYLKSSVLNEPFSFFNLYYDRAYNVEQKLVLLKKGADLKDFRAAQRLGNKTFFGRKGCEKNETLGLQLLRLSAQQDYPQAVYQLGQTLSHAGYKAFSIEIIGEPYYKRAAALGHRESVQAQGRLYHNQQNHRKALGYYIHTLNMPGDTISEEGILEGHIGVCYDELKDRLQATRWINIAIRKGEMKSIKNKCEWQYF